MVGHLWHQLEAYFGSVWQDTEIRYVVQHEALGTAHAVSMGSTACVHHEPTIVVQGEAERIIEESSRIEIDILEGASGYHDHTITHLSGFRWIDYTEGRPRRISCSMEAVEALFASAKPSGRQFPDIIPLFVSWLETKPRGLDEMTYKALWGNVSRETSVGSLSP